MKLGWIDMLFLVTVILWATDRAAKRVIDHIDKSRGQ